LLGQFVEEFTVEWTSSGSNVSTGNNGLDIKCLDVQKEEEMKRTLRSLKCEIKNLWTEHELARTVETRSDELGIN
jgi:hypothetical protein